MSNMDGLDSPTTGSETAMLFEAKTNVRSSLLMGECKVRI